MRYSDTWSANLACVRERLFHGDLQDGDVDLDRQSCSVHFYVSIAANRCSQQLLNVAGRSLRLIPSHLQLDKYLPRQREATVSTSYVLWVNVRPPGDVATGEGPPPAGDSS